MTSRLMAAVWATTAVGLAITGCGTTIDVPDLESRLADQVEAEVGVTPSVACPDEIEAEEGREFSCEAVVEGRDPVDLEVTLTDDDGGYRVTIDRTDFVDTIPGPNLEAAITEQFIPQLPFDFVIECPDEIEAEEGAELRCELTADDGSTAPVEVELTDDEGGFRAAMGEE